MSSIAKRPAKVCLGTPEHDGSSVFDRKVTNISWYRVESIDMQILRYRSSVRSFIMSMGLRITETSIQYMNDIFKYVAEDLTHETITPSSIFYFMKVCSLIDSIISSDLSNFCDMCLAKCLKPEIIFDEINSEYELPDFITETELWEIFSDYYLFDTCLDEKTRINMKKIYELNRFFIIASEQYSRDELQTCFALRFTNYFDFGSFCSLLGLILDQYMEKFRNEHKFLQIM